MTEKKTNTPQFKPGTKVKLGDGRIGKIVRKEERVGFEGYIVKIIDSIDKTQVGQTVGATAHGMKKISVVDVTTTPKTMETPEAIQETQKSTHLSDMDRYKIMQMLSELDDIQNRIKGMFRMASRHWVKAEHVGAIIDINDKSIECDVAVTPRQQASGLQAYDNLSRDRGLWFPQSKRRVAAFHMGEVKFPIDIIFVDNGTINKIASDIKPHQMGSWCSVCTDVIEVNGKWCQENNINIGGKVATPLDKKIAQKDIERLLNVSWSAPQDARITSTRTSFDPLRSLTEASQGDLSWTPTYDIIMKDLGIGDQFGRFTPVESHELDALEDLEKIKEDLRKFEDLYKRHPYQYMAKKIYQISNMIEAKAKNIYNGLLARHKQTFAKEAQENRQVKPITYREQPGEVDKRNPTDRFEHHTLPDEYSPFGDGDTSDVDPFIDMGTPDSNDPGTEGVSRMHYHTTEGWDPALSDDSFTTGLTPVDIKEHGLKAPVRRGSKMSIDPQILATGSLNLYKSHEPEWSDGSMHGYDKLAILSDKTISSWIDSLNFEEQNEEALRQIMFTDDYKRLLGDKLVTEGEITNYDLFDSDLILYK